MPTDTAEVVTEAAPSEEANLAPPQPNEQTEDAPTGDVAVAPVEEAVASEGSELQVEVAPPVPQGLTPEQRAEAERIVDERSERIRAGVLEEERNRRRTQAAREAQAAERAEKRLKRTVDTVKVALVSRNYDPDVATDESVIAAIDAVAQDRAESLVGEQASLVGEAWDFIAAPVYGKEVELDPSFEPAAKLLAPKVQHLIDTIRPQIEAQARKGWIAESDLPARVDAEIARRAAKGREGQTELARPSGQPAAANHGSIEYWEQRVAHEGEDGVPDMSGADWATYKALRRQHGYN